MNRFKLALSVSTLLILTVLFSNSASCQNKDNNLPNQDHIFSVEDDDTAMNNAISKARASLNKFKSALASDRRASNFSVKLEYPTAESSEHIWLSNITIGPSGMKGVIDNEPANIPSIRLGDRIKINEAQITDWMYFKNDSIYGGYTIRVLRTYMTDSEKASLDASLGLPFAQ